MKQTWEADPKKYEEMSKPFETEEEAERVVGEFFNSIRKLREQYRIAEVTMQAQVYIQTPDGILRMRSGGGWGSQLEQAKMAKRSADQEMNHLLILIRQLTQALPVDDGLGLANDMLLTAIEQFIEAVPETRKALITDPQFERATPAA